MDSWSETPTRDYERSLNTGPVGHRETGEPHDLAALGITRVQEPGHVSGSCTTALVLGAEG